MKNKKLFILDLDGTLLESIDKISDKSLNYLKSIKDKHVVCIVTGRPIPGAVKFHKQLELETVMGNLNGSTIYDPVNHVVHLQLNFSTYELKDFMKRNKNMVLEFAYQKNNVVFSTNNYHKYIADWFHKRIWSIISDPVKSLPEELECAFLAIEAKNEKMFEDFFEDSTTVLYHKWESIKNIDGKAVRIYELFSRNGSKGTTVAYLGEYYNVKPENIYVFGDGRNDISMFKLAKNSYAMGNAHPDLIEHASEHLKLTNKEDGVIEKIKEILQ